MTLESDGCRRRTRDSVLYLEHVQSIITLTSSRRGEIQIFLTSPAGTKSTLLQRRVRDTSTEGFTEWSFMTTHNWGEMSLGTWTLEVENGDSTCKYSYIGTHLCHGVVAVVLGFYLVIDWYLYSIWYLPG